MLASEIGSMTLSCRAAVLSTLVILKKFLKNAWICCGRAVIWFFCLVLYSEHHMARIDFVTPGYHISKIYSEMNRWRASQFEDMFTQNDQARIVKLVRIKDVQFWWFRKVASKFMMNCP